MRMRVRFYLIPLLFPLGILGPAAFTGANAPTPHSLVWEKPIARGLVYRVEIDYAAHHSIFALRMSLSSGAVRATCALAGGKTYEQGNPTGRVPVGQIVASESAVAGVNGDFFSMEQAPTGDPLGLTVRDGRILSTPSKRVAFGWGSGGATLATATFEASISSKVGGVDLPPIKIDGINRRCPNDQITLDTEDAGQAIGDSTSLYVHLKLSSPSWLPSTVVRGTISSLTSQKSEQPIAPDEAVLVARGNKVAILGQLKEGSECYVTLKTGGFDWSKIDSVIGGGPMQVRGGAIAVDAAAEGFNSDFSEKKHPRTAIGRTVDNDLWIVAVDGRQETGDGMTLVELAQLMKHLGCVDAMNLDGGGSTTMNIRGVTVNRPSDGKERPVADAVVILGPKASSPDAKLQLLAPSILAAGSNNQVAQVLDHGKPVHNLEVIWGATGSCAIGGNGRITAIGKGDGVISAACRGKVMTMKVQVPNG